MLTLSSIFVLFFITLGPIKTIIPFVQLTAHADSSLCRIVALRAALASTAIVLTLCVVGPLLLKNWNVSFDAVALTGGLILVVLPLQMMLKSDESPPSRGEATEAIPTSMLISRLVIPTIVTPPGIATILALTVLSRGNQPSWLAVVVLLVLIMITNLVAMIAARKLLGFITAAGLRVIGWVFAVLQASLGMQVLLNSLRRLGALPIP
ncbi:MarC family protein [Cyanobium sp. Candia 9D4]|jgi:multiple antibiotic resistance protein|uniref:MarC family protein n=1 Tax=Cyanobium sp. Candia 9D4 TaxID=2823707 RepID=UPI0020CDA137|nr:MarC family protein [Cyanobium sp. Candia 9D4]MCP9933603.1 MarC family protein [Cyanobium sp. Candia 9D4]